MASFQPIVSRIYDYEIDIAPTLGGLLSAFTLNISESVRAIEIQTRTENHWWILDTANYHDSFYYSSVDPTKVIPTQITGAVGEAMAQIIFRRLFRARRIRRIMPRPSEAADSSMEILSHTGVWRRILVESKASDSSFFASCKRGELRPNATS